MPLSVEQLREELLALPMEQREDLISSLPSQAKWPDDLHPDWAAQLDYRMQEMHAGRMTSIGVEEFKAHLEKRSLSK